MLRMISWTSCSLVEEKFVGRVWSMQFWTGLVEQIGHLQIIPLVLQLGWPSWFFSKEQRPSWFLVSMVLLKLWGKIRLFTIGCWSNHIFQTLLSLLVCNWCFQKQYFFLCLCQIVQSRGRYIIVEGVMTLFFMSWIWYVSYGVIFVCSSSIHYVVDMMDVSICCVLLDVLCVCVLIGCVCSAVKFYMRSDVLVHVLMHKCVMFRCGYYYYASLSVLLWSMCCSVKIAC